MRLLTRVFRVLLAGGVLLAAGCGRKYELPPQPPPAQPPLPGYGLHAVWDLAGASPTDLASQASYLYVVESDTVGTVRAYIPTRREPRHPVFIGAFEGLVRPHHLALGKRDSLFVFVADGDTIKKYLDIGGPELGRFTDPRWNGTIRGLAADNRLYVYVAFADRVIQYDDRGREVRIVADSRSGAGQVKEPHGMHWTGTELLVADRLTNLVVRLDPDRTNTPTDTALAWPGLLEPSDVVADKEFIYVADTGHHRVLKYRRGGGAFVDSVYSPYDEATAIAGDPLERPRYLALDNPESNADVFVSDADRNRVAVFRLSTQ